MNHVWLFATLRTISCQAPLSMGFSGQECWSGLPCPPPGDPPDPGIEPHRLCLLHRQTGSFPLAPRGKPWYGKCAVLCCAKSLQSCPALWDPMDCSPLGSSGHGIIPTWCWSGLPFPPPGNLPNPEIEPMSSAAAALAGRFLSLAHFHFSFSSWHVGVLHIFWMLTLSWF